ncbi:MAG: hypothetical protein HKN13_00650 [Rhodothermales bacterium]|nr:hypothetical protein [Rhodothermales bacterium]
MTSTKLRDWLEIVGLFSVVASLIFVGMQMRQEAAIAATDSVWSRSGAVTTLSELINNNSDVWIAGLRGEELTPAEEAEFQGMAEAVESYFVATYVRFTSFRAVSGGPEAQQAIDDYAYALYVHKGLRRVWRTQLNYWDAQNPASGVERSEVFTGTVESTLRQLDERAAPIPDEVRYVFW